MKTPLRTSFDEENLRTLVYRFYQRVREDALLGPVFERAIGSEDADWKPHLQTMTNFWCMVMLHKPVYKGNPVVRHMAVDGIEPEHFARWMELFEEVAAELYEEPTSTYIVGRAQNMRRHLTRNLFGESIA